MSEPFWSALGAPGGPGGVDYEGVWSNTFPYQAGDVVSYGGVNWLAVNPSTGVSPASGVLDIPVPAARVYRTTTLAAGTGGTTYLSFDAERFDTDNMHDLAVNPSRLTCRTAGKYLAGGQVEWASPASPAGNRVLDIYFNGAFSIARTRAAGTSGAASDALNQSVHAIYDMAVGDYLELAVFHTQGASLNIGSAPQYSPEFWATRIGSAVLSPTPGAAPLVTALPSSPADGQEIILTDSLTAPTYTWHFRYVAAKATNKWVFVGGAPCFSTVATAQAVSPLVSWSDTATVGPTFTVPVTGIYLLDAYSKVSTGATIPEAAEIGVADNGAQTPPLSGGVDIARANTFGGAGITTQRTLTAGWVPRVRYFAYAATTTFSGRTLQVTPVAVGG